MAPVRNPLRLILLVVLLAAPLGAVAERPPARVYTAADGLGADENVGVLADSRGFLWFHSADGVSRFDGYAFTTYTTADGLPDRRVWDLVETRDGGYVVATAGGLARFDPRGVRGTERPPFVRVPTGDDPESAVANCIVETRDGTLWFGARGGLYRIDAGGAPARVDVGLEGTVSALFEDARGELWAGARAGVARVRRDGRVETFRMPERLVDANVNLIFEDASGRLWACTDSWVAVTAARASSDDPVTFGAAMPSAGYGGITAYLRPRDGTEWIMSSGALWRIAAGTSEPVLERVPAILGVCDRQLWDLAEDRDGNLWLATACGAVCVDRQGFATYGAADGLSSLAVNSIFESRAGDLVVTTNQDARVVHRLDGARFAPTVANIPTVRTGWGWAQTVIQDHEGAWWVVSGTGVHRYPKADRPDDALRSQPEAIVAGQEIFRVFEDSRGDVWLARTQPRGLLRWERETERVVDVTAETGVDAEYASFVETADGAVWIGTGGAGLLRYVGGRFERFAEADGAPAGWLRALHVDGAGRLWIASSLGGLARVDDPSAGRVAFARYTTAHELASDNVWCVTTDAWGRVYVGMPKGVDRLDPATGRVKHFTTDDGLPKGSVQQAYRDGAGRLWFGTAFGLARFDPEPERSREPPRTVVTGLRVAGVGRPVSALGESSVGGLDLAPSENSVSVDFLGLGTRLGEELRYQYRLEGAGEDWSAPTAERTVTFANLGAGSYRFLVRAVDADGHASAESAAVAFAIAAPIWQRWWFLALATAIVCGAAYSLYRYRVARLLEVERVRTRIATDLHDDIGANLTRIAFLSETAALDPGREGALSSIARISRESVMSMNDIVWAIDPNRDTLRDLVQRMRQYAEEVFDARDVDLEFTAEEEVALRLGHELRRQLYLVFKEAANNAARHSGCSRAEVALRVDGRRLVLEVSDDGRGFDVASPRRGNGLTNLRKRASALGADLDITSEPGRGTRVVVSVSLGHPA